ncbi:MAG: tetratricopeptide repeat protein, partial [Byssovorax sp.]
MLRDVGWDRLLHGVASESTGTAREDATGGRTPAAFLDVAMGRALDALRMNAAIVRGKVDFGIITIREDEFIAVLDKFPDEIEIVSGRSQYNLRRLTLSDGKSYTVAIVRCVAQGNGEAQQVANALIEELAPRWLLVVGIGGAVPATERTLGDVVVSTHVADFNVGAVLQDGSHEYALQVVENHRHVTKHAANLAALRGKLGAWNSADSVGLPRPGVKITAKSLYGDASWKKKVKESLEHHLAEAREAPRVSAGAIACSDLVIKDAELLQVWLKITRQVIAVEMESAGVGRAARARDVPFFSIRGLSDVVGFRRDPKWTEYACHSAAAFTRAFLLTRPIEPIQPIEPGPGGELVPPVRLTPEGDKTGRRSEAAASLRAEMARAPETRHSTLPSYRRSAPFSGRAKDLTAIADKLARPEQTDVLVLHGPPGVGKSRLAVEYAITHREHYPGGAFFVSFDLTPPTDLARLLDLFGLARGAGESLEEQCRRALAHLATRRSLLIYDNVPDAEILDEWLPRDGLLCDVLATSTSAYWRAGWTAHRLDPLDEGDARALVEKVIRDRDAARRWVDQLVTDARGITVELVAAANAIDHEARHRRSGAPSDSLADETISSFGRAWRILSEDAKLVLRTAALFETTRIPPEALRALWIGEGWSESRFNTALDAAQDRTLIAAKGEVLDMHQCIARFVREQSGPTMSEAVRRRHLDGFLQAAERFCEHPADPQLGAGLRAYPANVTFWSTVFPDDGAALAAAANALGAGLSMDGQFDEARGWFERGVAAKEKGDMHGRVDPESLGVSLHAVGYCYESTGRYDEARGWFERAVAAKEKGDMHGRVDPASLGVSVHAVGYCYSSTGKYDEARRWFERAVAEAEKGDVHGRVDPASLGKSLHQVGSCYLSTGQDDEARGWFERAVAEAEKGDMHGRVDPESLGSSLHQVGYCYASTGKYDEARGWFERAVAEAEKNDMHGRVDPESLGSSLH